MGRPRTDGREHMLPVPDGFERSDYVQDLRVADRVQLKRRKSWALVLAVDNWYVHVLVRNRSTLCQRSTIIDAIRAKKLPNGFHAAKAAIAAAKDRGVQDPAELKRVAAEAMDEVQQHALRSRRRRGARGQQ